MPAWGSRFFPFDIQDFLNITASGVNAARYEVDAPSTRNPGSAIVKVPASMFINSYDCLHHIYIVAVDPPPSNFSTPKCSINFLVFRKKDLTWYYRGVERSNMSIFHRVHLCNEQMHIRYLCSLAHMSFSTWMSYVHLLICDALLIFCRWSAYSVMGKYIVKFSHSVCHFFYYIDCLFNLSSY